MDGPTVGLLRDLRQRGLLDDTLVLFTTEFGRTPFTGRIEVPVKGVYGVAISPDGRYLAKAAADGKVRVWERS